MSETSFRTSGSVSSSESKPRDGTVDKTQGQSPEIMAQIFWHVSEGELALPPTGPQSYPWSLSHVCSRWKHILWSFSVLFNSVIVYDGSSHPRAVKNTRESLSSVLSNSDAPISLSVLCTNSEDVQTSDIILAYMHRFSFLGLYNVSQNLLFSIWALPPGSFEYLEHIYVTLEPSGVDLPGDSISVFESAPRLRAVIYIDSSNSLEYRRQMLLVPRSTISEICIVGIPAPARAVQDILLSCESLVSCQFAIEGEVITPSPVPVTLPKLERLTLEISHMFDWTAFFAPIRTPCLEQLCVSSDEVRPPFSTITLLVHQLKAPLKYLSMDFRRRIGDDVEQADIEPLLEDLPSLKGIHIQPWYILPSVLQRMQSGSLQLLTCMSVYVRPEGFTALLDFLDSYILPCPSSQNPPMDYMISCYGSPGYSSVGQRYLERYEAYMAVKGLQLCVSDAFTGRIYMPHCEGHR